MFASLLCVAEFYGICGATYGVFRQKMRKLTNLFSVILSVTLFFVVVVVVVLLLLLLSLLLPVCCFLCLLLVLFSGSETILVYYKIRCLGSGLHHDTEVLVGLLN